MVKNRRSLQPGVALWCIKHSIWFILLGLGVMFGFLTRPHFLSSYNVLNVLRQAAPTLIIAIGMTFVIATRGIDLSVGSIVGMLSIVIGVLLQKGWDTVTIVGIAIASGILAGAINGYFISALNLPPFIVTLATLTAFRGVALTITKGYAVGIYNNAFLNLSRGRLWNIPYPVLIAGGLFLCGVIVLERTRLGVHCLAIGGREDAARVVGVRIRNVKWIAYIMTGMFAGVAAVLITSHLGNGSPRAGEYLELDVITAVILGGTSLAGGEATMTGTLAGALFVKFLGNGLDLLGINPFIVRIVTGGILLLGVLFNTVVATRIARAIKVSFAEAPSYGRYTR
ncbi:MAG: ABC transporter permease [Candidatus Methanomethyliaceae archaeon]